MGGAGRPCQAPARLRPTDEESIRHVSLRCAGGIERVILRGKLAQQAPNYPLPMARWMACLIACQGTPGHIDDLFATGPRWTSTRRR